jgi:hypothetical protein
MRNQRAHGTGEADTVGEFSFDHVQEGVSSVEVEERGYLRAVQTDVRVALRRAAAIEFALVRGSDTAGEGHLPSRGLHIDGPRIHARWVFMATAPSTRSRSS